MALTACQKEKKENEAKAYINPEIAEEHRLKGNELFKNGDYPNALKEYDDGLNAKPNLKELSANVIYE